MILNKFLVTLIFIIMISVNLFSQEKKMNFDLVLNSWRTFNANWPIQSSLRQSNARASVFYNLKENQAIGITTSLNTFFRHPSSKQSDGLFKENFYFLEFIPNYQYNLFGYKKLVVNHGVGFLVGLNVPNYSVDADVDSRFLNNIVYINQNGYPKVATLKNLYGFIETGIDFYLYKGLHLSLTGRATLLSYTLNYDYEGEPLNPNPKKLGLNYMLFYGLGYTFGKN